MRTVVLEILEPAEIAGIEYHVFCNGALRLVMHYGEYAFLDIDENEHILSCRQYAKAAQEEHPPIFRQQSLPVRIPKGNEELQIAIREELGQLRFVLQTDLSS